MQLSCKLRLSCPLPLYSTGSRLQYVHRVHFVYLTIWPVFELNRIVSRFSFLIPKNQKWKHYALALALDSAHYAVTLVGDEMYEQAKNSIQELTKNSWVKTLREYVQ